ncbi:carbamoyl-phosphate synthase large subunit [Bradyrhizobium sp. i1.4.4]
MPKRTDITTILIIGAGPIVIGQACEFDYSGTQAVKTLKEEGYRIVLVNSNPATIMTDPELADATYIEPITPEIVAKIIEKERHVIPGGFALLPTMGGQTALNCALSLRRQGTLEKFDVEMIGATADAIDKAEDRQLFREAMTKIGLETPKSRLANASELKKSFRDKHRAEREKLSGAALEEHERQWVLGESDRRKRYQEYALGQALMALSEIGLPAIIRPSFTMGGTGGGIAYNKEEFLDIIERGLDASPTNEVLIEESVLGWKEYEMEVVRDKKDNCIIVCSIENLDPMGVHTGDSITVAPALTLTDKEYQIMRDASLAVLREIGVETGGSNVQFGVNPEDGRMVVIEMNPRVSRSSALASKATGFPIAKVAAKLAVGYTLDEIANDITGGATPASFEPTIDYVVTKIPRFAFEKFPGASTTLTTSMKSVGEVMAIGRTFQESLQKALRGLETGLTGLDEIEIEGLGQHDDKNAIRAALGTPTPNRLLQVAQAMRLGWSNEDIFNSCKIDPWFLSEMRGIVDMEEKVRKNGLPGNAFGMRTLKAMGFSDARLAVLVASTEAEVTAKRHALDVRPVYKRIDTCAAEFASPTAYMYSTYEALFAGAPADESSPSDKKKVIILGGGPNRIGQGIEFDYCCCHACFALHDAGYESIMVNCNPETVSTDYDTADRLYFEPLTAEDVLEIIAKERTNGTLHGVIVQFGGQTPLKLARALEAAEVPILGTSPDAIDLAEDRDRFKRVLDKLRLKQPKNGIAYSVEQARLVATDLGLPLVVRPSYVLGGRAMQIIREENQLSDYLLGTLPELVPADVKARYPNDKTGQINTVLGKNPLLFDRYLSDATEIDVDCLCDGKDTFIVGIMEHIEEAGIHSGDSACSLPPHSLDARMIEELERQTRELALGPRRRRPDECAVRDQGRRDLRARSQSARLAHGALRRQGGRHAGRQDRSAHHGRREARRLQAEEGGLQACRCEGIGVSVRPLPRRRHGARPRDALDRRGDGHRQLLRDSLCQESARRRHAGAAQGHGVRLGSRERQDAHRRGRSRIAFARLQGAGDIGHGALPDRSGHPRPRGSTRCLRDGRTSSMPSPMATSSSSSTLPRARRRSPTAARCGARPSCIKCRITPLFPGPWRPRRASAPIWAGTLRFVPCRATFRKPDR